MKAFLSAIAKLPALAEFFIFYLKEVVLSNFRVAYDVMKPVPSFEPGIIKVGISELTDQQLMAMANLITMTPGTLSLDVSEDRQFLFVHGMYVKDPKEAARELEENYSRRVRRVF